MTINGGAELLRECDIMPPYRPSSPMGATNMPSTVNLYAIGVWFCVGFFTGAGWAIAASLVGRVLRF